ncbi:MAG: transposase-like protein [Parvibaculaceae bacterium]|jgi:transposase-like protein
MPKRHKFSTSFKKQVALAALRGDKIIQELAAHHRLHPNQTSQWKRQAVDGLDGVFAATPARIPPLTEERHMRLPGNQEL